MKKHAAVTLNPEIHGDSKSFISKVNISFCSSRICMNDSASDAKSTRNKANFTLTQT